MTGKAKKRVAEGEQSGSLEKNAPLEEAPSSADASKVSRKKKKKKDGKKRPREDPSIGQHETPAVVGEDNMETPVQTGSTRESPEERPKKKLKKKTVEEGLEDPSRSGGKASGSRGETRNESPLSERLAPSLVVRKDARSEGSLPKNGRIESPDRVEFLYDEKTPLVLNPLQCAELTRQIRGGTRELPPIGDVYFKDEDIDAASVSKRLSVIERLRAENKKASDKVAEEKEVLRAKFEELEGKLKADRLAKNEMMREKTHLERNGSALEKEKAEFEGERDAVVETLVKERQRLRDSRFREVTCERVRVQTAMGDKSTRCFGRVRDDLARLDAFEKAKSFDILHIYIVLSIYSCIGVPHEVLGDIRVRLELKRGIGVPHGVLGDIWVRLELKRGDQGDHWTSNAWERPTGATP
ncbi:hypothetical protein F2Q68_00030560 [Brassica cretica]|uniref:Uncharacterized protein n=1 Tax=Brassica cretica TaxID=69181 RepID=A0A8S9G5S4_BRACR|nr:hypothetical protein F2Q68_00030560 [Brassica cretica]